MLIEGNYTTQRERAIIEQTLLNAVVNNSDFVEKVDETFFKRLVNKKVFGIVSAAYKTQLQITPDWVTTKAQSMLSEDSAEQLEVLCKVHSYTEDELNHWVAQSKELLARENVIQIAQSALTQASEGHPIKEVCALGQLITEQLQGLSRDAMVYSVGDALEGALTEIEHVIASGAEVGVPYHLKSLQKNLVGMFPTDLVIVAARPSVGKTALALNLAYHASEGAFGIISSEMSKEQLAKRWISMETGINGNLLRDPRGLTTDDQNQIRSAVAKLKGRKFWIEDKGAINIAEIEDIVEIWVKLHGVQVVMVDYIQRINSDRNHNSEAEKIGWVTKRLKEMAKKFGICVIGLAQINRENTKENRRPRMSDLKGSGDIEQEADAIILMHKPSMGTAAANEDCFIEGIIEKNRHGQVGLTLMVYQPKKINFIDPTPEQRESYIDE